MSTELEQLIPKNPRRALRVSEVQLALGVGRTKIYQWINDGRLASVRIDGARLIPVEAVESLLAAPNNERVEEPNTE